MYGIYSDNELLAAVQKPRYVRKKESSGAWVEAEDESKAEALAFDGEIFNLAGKAKVDENAKTVMVSKIDSNLIFKGYKESIDSANDMVLTALMAITDLYEEVTGK